MVIHVGNSPIPLNVVPTEADLASLSQTSGFKEFLQSFDDPFHSTGQGDRELGFEFDGKERDQHPVLSTEFDDVSLIDLVERLKADKQLENVLLSTVVTETSIAEQGAAEGVANELTNVFTKSFSDKLSQHLNVKDDVSTYEQLRIVLGGVDEKVATEIGAQRGNYFHMLRATGTLDNIQTATAPQSLEAQSSSALPTPLSAFGSLNAFGYGQSVNSTSQAYSMSFEALNAKAMNDKMNANFFQNDGIKSKEVNDKDVKKFFLSHWLPLTEEITKSYIKTVSYPDKVKVYYRDYTGDIDKEAIRQMIDVLHRHSGNLVAITYNGKTEVFYGSAAYQ